MAPSKTSRVTIVTTEGIEFAYNNVTEVTRLDDCLELRQEKGSVHTFVMHIIRRWHRYPE